MSEPFKINTNQRKTKVCFYLNWLVDLWMSAVSPGGTAIQQLNSLSIPIKFINYWWNLMEWREWVCWLQPPQPTIHQTAQLSCCLIGLVACLLPSLVGQPTSLLASIEFHFISIQFQQSAQLTGIISIEFNSTLFHFLQLKSKVNCWEEKREEMVYSSFNQLIISWMLIGLVMAAAAAPLHFFISFFPFSKLIKKVNQ